MLSDDQVWEVRGEGDETPVEPAKATSRSFKAEDVRWLVRVPSDEVEEFFRLSSANDYDEIARRWGADKADAGKPETQALGYYEITSVRSPS